jgi:K+-transporting ATPase ATPase C chain
MFKEALEQMKTAFILLMFFLLLTGIVYPFVITEIAQWLFPEKANGSLIRRDNQVIGSRLIGQSFSSDTFFWGRPSATTPHPYNGEASSGSNLAPTNPHFIALVKERMKQFKSDSMNQKIPVDLVTASGSGLDPDISPYAAMYQVPRVAKANHLSEEALENLIQQQMKSRTWGLFGEPRVNVLELNLALERLRMKHGQSAPKS